MEIRPHCVLGLHLEQQWELEPVLNSGQGALGEALVPYVPVGCILALAAPRCPVPVTMASAHVHLLYSSLRVLEPCPGLQPAWLDPDNLPFAICRLVSCFNLNGHSCP